MSNKIQKTIEINAKVKASLEGMKKTVGELERGLEKQKFDLSKNSGLSKLIKDYKAAKAELDELMSGDVIARTDIKKAEQLGGKVSKLYKQIGKSFEDLRAGSDDTFRKLFPDSFTAKISKGTKAIENFFSKLDSKTVKEGRLDEVRKDLTRLSDELDGLKNRRLKIEVDIDKKGVKDELDRINKDLEQMRENFKKKLIPEEKRDSQGRTQTERLNSSVSTWSNKLAQDTDARKNLKVQSLSKSQSSQISKLEGQLVDAQGANLADIEKKRLDALHAEQTKRATIAKTPGARDTSRNRREYGGVTDKELAAQIAASEKELQRLRAIADKIDDIKQQPQRAYDAAVKKLETQIKTDRTNLEKAERALEAHTTQRENQEAVASQKADDFMAGKQVAEATQAEIDALKALNDEKQKNLDLEKKLKEEKSFDSQKTKDSAIAKKDSSIEKKKLEIQELENTIKNLANDTNFDAIFKKLKELGVNTEGIDKTRAGLEGIKKDLESLDENTLKEIREALNQMGVDAEDTDTKVDTLTQGVEQLGDTDKDLKRAENEMENLKNQVLQFFSLTNAVQLFKRTVQSAINTVKELDAVMTETAVVTDFTIGDMWEKLPQYSVQASALGASIRDLYSATTLYYQQGLQTNEAMGVGTETMKMARIANMEATDATTAMTAALRGFNMEVNEMNAQRVNDVYSELAAITAADTSQIATAMGKTASIAASANMEFETTSALLAQIIETTQEAPETAGTAMKTIIARFTEVKELFSEGMLTGEDEEGEEININKIDTALKSVGISLKDFLNGQKGIDDIFLELASKWDTLDLATQRYIATTAAGSRQQSRFIAMMSNYDRTMELVNAANNSAGASQEQFNKTLDSLDAKLQQLNNAWDEFIMGIANNEVIKFGVDALTLLLNTVNGLTSALSGEGGLSKSIVSLLAVTGTLMGGKGLFEKAFGVVDGIKATGPDGQIFNLNFNKKGEQAGTQWLAGFKRATDSKKTGGSFGASLGSFLGEKVEGKRTYKRKMTEAELAEYNKKNLKDAALDIYSGSAMADTTKAESIYGRLSAGDISLQQAQKELADLGVQTEIVDNQLVTVSETIKATKVDFTSLGMAATGAGMALSLFGGLFDKMGWEEGAEAVKKVGAALTTVGSIVMLLGPMFNKLGITVAKTGLYFGKAGAEALASGAAATLGWGPFIGIAVAVLAVVGLLVAAFIAIRNASPEYQLEQASEAAEKAGQAAEEAAEKYDQLAASLDSVSSKEAALDNLAAGTREWKEAVADLNNEVLDLIAAYPELAQYVDSQDGVLRFTDEDAVEGILNSYADAEINAQSAKAAAQIEVQKRQQDVDFSSLPDKLIAPQGNVEYRYNDGTEDGMTKEEFYNYHRNAGLNDEEIRGLWDTTNLTPFAIQNERQIIEQIAKDYASGNIDENDSELAYLAGDREALNELRAFGQSLIASEAAIDAYSEAILNNAAIASDLNDEQKSELEGMIGPDGIQSLIDTEKEALGRKTSEDLREDYAEAMNYEIVDGKIYSGYGEDRKEVVVSDDEIKSQLAAISAQDKITKAMQALSRQSDNLSEAFKGLLKDSDGLGLTLKELDELSSEDFDWNALWESLPQAVQDLYGGNKEAFEAESQAEIAAANSRKQEMDASLRAIGKEELFVDNNKKPLDLDLGTLSQITDSLYNTAIQSGTTAAQELGDSVAELLKGDSSEQAQIFAEALNMIDWSSVESVEQLNEVLDDLGYTGNIAEGTIEELEDKIMSASNATRNFNWDSFKEELKTTEELVEDIKGREDTERTFTEEQRDDILNKVSEDKRAELESQFVMTGADEWTYIGDSMQGLIVALDANTAALLGKSAQQIVDQANRSQAWIDVAESEKTYGFGNWENVGGGAEVFVTQTGGLTLPEIIENYIVGNNTDSQLTMAGLKELMTDLKLSTEGSYEVLIDRLKDFYNEDYGANGLKAQENITKAEPYLYDTATYQYSNMTGQQILDNNQLLEDSEQDSEARMDAIETKLSIIENGKTEASVTNDEIIANSSEEIKNNTNALLNYEKAVKATVIDSANLEKKMESLSESIKDNAEILQSGEEESEAYQKALDKISVQAQETFGENYTKDFVKDNLPLFIDWANGVEGSAEKIRDAMIDSLEAAGKDVTELRENVAALDGAQFNIYGYASMGQARGELYATEEAAQVAAEQIEALGMYEVTVVSLGEDLNGVPLGWDVIVSGAGNKVEDENRLSGGGGGGGGGSEEAWENPYDKLYNLTREINEELRERERIERRYEKLLEKRLATAEQLSELSFSELDQLELEAELQREFISGRQQQIADLLAENPDMEQYFTVSTDENGEQIIRIDWDAINAVTDTEEGERIEEVLGKVEDWSDDIEDANDTLNDIEDTVFEIKERGKDEYMDLEDQIKEALTQVYQDEIDKLNDINDSINDTNNRLLDAVQRSIDEQRQERENAKTEEELSDKRSRLAYLQQDTSGANALEILKLQEEIAQGEEDYTDSLIDQKISELQRQNDEAAAQREQQINIAQAQLDHYIETGAIWQEVYSLMTSGLNEKTGLIRGSRLEEVLQKAENFNGLSTIGKMEWLKDLETNIASALSYLRVGRQIEDLGITSGQISFTTKDGKTLTGTVDSSGNVTTSDGKVFDDVYQGSNGFYYSNKTEAEGTVKKPEPPAPATPVVTKKTNPYGNASETTGLIYEGMTGTQVKSIQWALKEMGYDIGAEGIDGVYGWATKRAVTQFQTDFHREHPNERMSTPDGIVGPNTRNAFRIKQYKTGGLADFTGPAWLDGTKSRPEYILNADQTRAFFELVDVLSALKTNSSITTQNSGDNTYDIDINVESIGSDYDVEQLANTVKRLINDDARYRNNNIAGHTR